MNVGAALIGLLLGVFYGRLMARGNLIFFAFALAFTGLGLGNYPGYPVQGLSIVFVAAGLGIIISEVGER